MLSIGSQVTVTIADLAFGGDGVARTQEGVVFVPYTAVGDEALIEITETRKNFARGKLLQVITPGPGRAAPRCPHFGVCGGCQYQHLDYATEFAAKRKQLQDILRRIGRFQELPPPEPSCAAAEPYGYRNKIRLEARPAQAENGRKYADYGYLQNDNKSFLKVTHCPLGRPELGKLLHQAIDSQWNQHNAHRKDQQAPAALTLRIDSRGETEFYFGFAPGRISWLNERLNDIEYKVPAEAFWQINPPVAGQLVKTMDLWTRELPLTSLIDAYGGVGTFSCALTNPSIIERLLIESFRQATEAAQYNLQQCGYGCQIVAETTERALPRRLPKFPAKTTLVVLDPPRTGCQDKVLQALRAARPAYVAYVSCNPSTLARDLRTLCEGDVYRLTRLAIFDMFPRTAHFETATLLTAQSSPTGEPNG
ncbi:MAG: class I SAM-dependent RNA methyltransferase [Victivallales bacterium]|nr:class I SAM-dependent RNA methyltransferase [Victivallales bacterium]